MVNLTYTQYVAMTIAGIISATLSLIGSSLILFLARTKWKEPQHRIVSWLSVTDILYTFFGVYAQVWFTPQESPLNLYWAHGNLTTCAVIGAISSWLRLAGSLLNCLLSIYFVLVVRYGWRNNGVLIRRRMEFPAYGIIILLPTFLMVLGLQSDSYRATPLLNICLVAKSTSPKPNCFPNCQTQQLNSLEKQQQGEESIDFGALTALIIVIASLTGFICTFLVNWRVRQQMRLTQQSSMTGLSSNLATEVAWQSIWYSLAYFNTFIWPILLMPIFRARGISIIHQTGNPGLYMLSFVTAIFLPLQGALNCIVYIRPYYRQWLKVLPPETTTGWVILQHIVSGIDLPSTRGSSQYIISGRRQFSPHRQTSDGHNNHKSIPQTSGPISSDQSILPTLPPPTPAALIEEGEPLPISGSRIHWEEEEDNNNNGLTMSGVEMAPPLNDEMMTTTPKTNRLTFAGEIHPGVDDVDDDDAEKGADGTVS